MPNQDRGHRWFAAFYVRLSASVERTPFMKGVRQEIVGGARGRVLEVGAGTGASFPYYGDQADEIVATEPDPHMLKRARRRAEQAARPIELRQAGAEELPFEDAAFDSVVSTLVLCTVPDPDRALSEVRRVLKPGGELRFFEHVRYDHAFGAFWQDAVAPVWRWIGAGCNPNRDTAALIRAAGFEFDQLEFFKHHLPVPPLGFVRPHIKGVARPA